MDWGGWQVAHRAKNMRFRPAWLSNRLLPLIMHPRLDPQSPQLFRVRPGLIEHRRIILSNQCQASLSSQRYSIRSENTLANALKSLRWYWQIANTISQFTSS